MDRNVIMSKSNDGRTLYAEKNCSCFVFLGVFYLFIFFIGNLEKS